MGLRDLAELSSWRSKRFKEDLYAQDNAGDIPTAVHVYRSSALVAAALVPPGPGVLVEVARWCAYVMEADVLSSTYDTWCSTLRKNPVTGRTWEADEFQQVALDHDGLARGWVTEALLTTVCARDGGCITVQQPYERTEGGLTWSQALYSDGPEELDQNLVRTIFDAFEVTPLRVDLAGTAPEVAASLSVEEQQLYTDVVAARMMRSIGATPYLFAQPGTRRAEMLDEYANDPALAVRREFDPDKFRGPDAPPPAR